MAAEADEEGFARIQRSEPQKTLAVKWPLGREALASQCRSGGNHGARRVRTSRECRRYSVPAGNRWVPEVGMSEPALNDVSGTPS